MGGDPEFGNGGLFFIRCWAFISVGAATPPPKPELDLATADLALPWIWREPYPFNRGGHGGPPLRWVPAPANGVGFIQCSTDAPGCD